MLLPHLDTTWLASCSRLLKLGGWSSVFGKKSRISNKTPFRMICHNYKFLRGLQTLFPPRNTQWQNSLPSPTDKFVLSLIKFGDGGHIPRLSTS